MKEIVFIKQHKERWKQYEKPTNDPDELADRFVNLVDDLSYTRTHYPQSNIVNYLNNIASNIYLAIYATPPPKKNSFKHYILEVVPMSIFRQRSALLFSLVFFIAIYLIGLFIASKDASFIRAVLSDDYVNMTQENISKGKPFGVYGANNQWVMFFMIAWNNIRVAFMTFAAGILFLIGSLYFLFHNGIMVGAFHQMFIAHGFGWQWVFVVMIHGTLELFSIAIAGGCGIMLGNALLFPKTYTRMVSLKKASKDALNIMLVVLAMLLVAAVFESFVTRYEHMPLIISSSILILCLGFIVIYFGILPMKVHKRGLVVAQIKQEAFLKLPPREH